MALSKIDIENMVTVELTTTNGGTGATSFTAGISEADIWRLTTDFDASATPIASNLERADTDASNKIGTGMSQSSGIFTFPSTGIYYIQFQANFLAANIDGLLHCKIEVSTNTGSSYGTAAVGDSGVSRASDQNQAMCHLIVDITNTSTHLVRFDIAGTSSDTTTQGDSGHNETSMMFLRLGDT